MKPSEMRAEIARLTKLTQRQRATIGRVSARDLYRAASGWRRAVEHGLTLCDLCHRVASRGWTCEACRAALDKARAA